MQFSPALPWAAGTRGTITLRTPVTKRDLVNGILTFVSGTDFIYRPEENDGYVDYYYKQDDSESIAFSIAIGDEEETNVLQVTSPIDDNISQVLISGAVGTIDTINFVDESLEPVTLGNEGFLIANCRDAENPEIINKVAISQDGTSIIKAIKVEDVLQQYKILSRSVPVSVNSLLKLSSSPASGAIAELPVLKAELYSFENNACLRIMHSSSNGIFDGANGLLLTDSNDQVVYWGDRVTELFVISDE